MPRNGVAIPVDPLNELGNPEDSFRNPSQLQFMRTLVDIIRRSFAKFINQETAVSFFHLQSPNGTVYRVTVNDDGTLRTENARARQISQITESP